MNDSTAGALAVLFILLPVLFIFAIAGYVVGSFFMMKLFQKAGVQGGWRAWVPVYNVLILAKLGDFSPWVLLGAIVASGLLGQIPVLGILISLVLIAAYVMLGWRVTIKAGYTWPLLLLWILGIGFFIWLGILAFSSKPWNPAVGPSPWASTFLADKTVWEGVPSQGGMPPAPGAYPPPPAAPPVV